MITLSLKKWLQMFLAFLFLFPAILFISASVLKYGLSINGLFDIVAPTLEKWGIKDPPGINITSIVVFGPVMAFLIAAVAIIKLHFNHQKERDILTIEVKNHFMFRVIIVLSVIVVSTLFIYLVLENINHG